MTYTILSARYANADHTSAVVETAEAGSVAASAVDTPDVWPAVVAANPAPWVAPEAASLPDPLTRLRAFLAANPDVADLIG